MRGVCHDALAAKPGSPKSGWSYDTVRIVLRILDIDAEALHEALVAQIVDRRLVGGEVEKHDVGVLGFVAEGALGPGADQFAGLKVICGKGRIGSVDRIERTANGKLEECLSLVPGPEDKLVGDK